MTMSLDQKDAAVIRNIFNDGVEELLIPRLVSLEDGQLAIDKRMRAQETATHELKTELESTTLTLNNRLRLVEDSIKDVGNKLDGIQNDIEEIYDRIVKIEKDIIVDIKELGKLPEDEQILQLNAAVMALAQDRGITLPR